MDFMDLTQLLRQPKPMLALVSVWIAAGWLGCGSESPSPSRYVLLDETAPSTTATAVPRGDEPLHNATNAPSPTAPSPNGSAARVSAPSESVVQRKGLRAIDLAEVTNKSRIERRLYADVRYLASDELKGRGIRTAGIDLAADYIADQFAQAGLRTDLFNGTPFHPFSYGKRTIVASQNLAFVQGNEMRELAHGDFQAIRRARSGPFTAPLAFVGYGIRCPEANYDDYANIDATGKAVVILRHEPGWGAGVALNIPRDRGEDKPSSHALLANKIALAKRQGAAAVLVCTDRATIAANGRERTSGGRLVVDPLMSFNPRAGNADEIPVFHIRREMAEAMLQPLSLDQWEQQVAASQQPDSRILENQRVEGSLTVRREGRQLKNVVGLLEGDGSEPRETIVIGAHYDHLGMGGAGSLAGWTVAVHNGADDNASGTAAMLEVARQLAARGPLRRRVLFIAFSAEESGLVGSERYVRAPLIPMDDTIAMLNLDMVGRLRKSMEVHGTRTAKEFNALLDMHAPLHNLRIQRYGDGYGPSDHASFYERGVPVLHFFTGLHSDYHRPSDDYDKVNIDGMRRISLLTADIATDLAMARQRPEAVRSDLFDLGGLGDLDLAGPARLPGRRVKLGIRTKDVEGEIRITHQFQRTAAETAGLRVGDVILSLDGVPLRGSQEFTEKIREAAAGSTHTLTIRRGRSELEIQATLGGK